MIDAKMIQIIIAALNVKEVIIQTKQLKNVKLVLITFKIVLIAPM